MSHVQAFFHKKDCFCWLILLSSLYIELARVCCTSPDKVHCFGTIFPNLNFVFASIRAARPVHVQIDQCRSCSTVKQRRAVGAAPFIPMGSNQKQLCGSEFAKWHDIYTPEECGDEWRQDNADLRLLENCVMNGFAGWLHHVRHHVHDGHWTWEFATGIWHLHCFTVSFLHLIEYLLTTFFPFLFNLYLFSIHFLHKVVLLWLPWLLMVRRSNYPCHRPAYHWFDKPSRNILIPILEGSVMN